MTAARRHAGVPLRLATLALFATRALLAPPAAAQSAPAPGAVDSVAAAFAHEVETRRVPGAVLVVVQDDRIVLRRAIGVRSVETGDPMTPETLFRVGSVTKLFTGVAALLAEGEGRLRLDAPAAQVAPDLHPAIGRLTPHALLTHTAGLANAAAGDGLHDDLALGARVRAWDERALFAPPGDVHAYASPGYWLAGHLLERAHDAPYATLVAERVLGPLGMTRSTFRPTTALTYPLALDHRPDSAGAPRVVRPYPDDVTTWPSGSLFASADDLARMARALLADGAVDGRPVLPPDVVRRMLTPLAAQPGGDCGYSYGLGVCTRDGRTIASHYGFRGGSGAVFTLVPDRRLAVIVLANGAGAILGATEQAALRHLAGFAAPTQAAGDAATPAPVSVPDSLLGRYAAGPDTLHLVRTPTGTAYRHRTTEQPVALVGAELHVGPAGRPRMVFMIVRGRVSGDAYLHDGLNAFRRLR